MTDEEILEYVKLKTDLQEYKEYLDSRCKEIVDWYNLMRKLKGGNA